MSNESSSLKFFKIDKHCPVEKQILILFLLLCDNKFNKIVSKIHFVFNKSKLNTHGHITGKDIFMSFGHLFYD